MRTLSLLLLAACTPRLYTTNVLGPTPDTDVTGWEWAVPENDWPSAVPPTGTLGEGFAVGQTVPDLRLVDQHGNEVSVWQFYGRVTILDISTMWCAPCQELAVGTQETQEDFGWESFAYLTVLQENVESQPPDTEDLELWADNFDIEAPVLADGDKATGPAVQNGQYPAVLLIDRDLTVFERVNPANDATLHSAVESLLGG